MAENVEGIKNPAAVALGRLGGLKGGNLIRALQASKQLRGRVRHFNGK